MKKYLLTNTFIVLYFLSACGSNQNSAAPDIWIDAPLPNSQYLMGEVVNIVFHAGDESGIKAVTLSLDGNLLATIPSDDPSLTLVTMHYDWLPTYPGEYQLSAISQNGNGVWGQPVYTQIIVSDQQTSASVDALPPTTIPTTNGEENQEECTDSAELISQAIPDDQVVTAGVSFTQEWVLQNTGSCEWNDDYRLDLISGSNISPANPIVYIPKPIPPGDSVSLSINLTAPQVPGFYIWLWEFRNGDGQKINVGNLGTDRIKVQFEVTTPVVAPTTPATNTPFPVDNQAPVINTLNWSPISPTNDEYITFTVTASDNVGVVRIEIYFAPQGQSNQPVYTCYNTTYCSYTPAQTFARGYYTYYAIAYDAAGNQISSFMQTIQVTEVIK